jgi:Ca-activated chloride channel homolog
MRALDRFIEMSHPDDEFFLMTFSDRAQLVHDFESPEDRLTSALLLAQPDGSTALYDAVYLAVEKVLQGRHSKKTLLIISDGQDNRSRLSLGDLRRRLQETDVLIYAIGITDPAVDPLTGWGQATLDEIAKVTGGRAFFPSKKESDLIEACTRIASELRHQYSIGFYPTDAESSNPLHKVEIKLKECKELGRVSLSYKRRYASFNNRFRDDNRKR